MLSVSVGQDSTSIPTNSKSSSNSNSTALKVLSIRTIDPPSRLTSSGTPNTLNTATGGLAPAGSVDAHVLREGTRERGVWTPPRGGIKRGLIGRVLKMVVQDDEEGGGGVGREVLEALEGIQNQDVR